MRIRVLWIKLDSFAKFGDCRLWKMPDSVCAAKQYVQSSRIDRKSTRLNSSHVSISYAVFCLKKKKNREQPSAEHAEGLLPPCRTHQSLEPPPRASGRCFAGDLPVCRSGADARSWRSAPLCDT